MSKGKESTMVTVGSANMVISTKVVAVLSPESAPMRRLKDVVQERNVLIDAIRERITRAIMITNSDRVIFSAVQVETPAQRFTGGEGA